ncbi:VWA domain-containing protein [bacterium]|nr:VWA domain-containing protein [bacterium]
MKKIFLSLLFLLQITSAQGAAVAPIPCGENAADIVLMLDRTGSISSTTRTKEAAAANAFIDAVTGTGTSHKISVGRFNDDTADDANDPTDTTDAAIYYSMSDASYSYTTLKTKVTAAMSSQGSGTNLEDAIEVAAKELITNGTHTKKVIVLLSDGESNRRDSLAEDNSESDDHLDYDSDATDHEADYLGAAKDAAEEARAQGITIIAIAYDNTIAGEKKYREVLADMTGNAAADDKTANDHDVTEQERTDENKDGDNFYIALGSNDDADLSTVFLAIAGAISCDDGNACTQDSCVENQCIFTASPSGKDDDGDNIDNCTDTCDNRIDTDQDGVADCVDICQGFDDSVDTDGDETPDGCDVESCNGIDDNGINGIDEGFPDSDNDGVADCVDECDDSVNTDGDNYPNCQEECDTDPYKSEPGECGCGNTDYEVGDSIVCYIDECPEGSGETDSDGDGVFDCYDQCPGQNDNLDSDGDLIVDCQDACPNDPRKTENVGPCGCGAVEVFGESVPRTINYIYYENYTCDYCPNDENKMEPGQCGCGVDDVDTDVDGVAECNDRCDGSDDSLDSDADEVPDCLDACPFDAAKSEVAGLCGCGVAETDTDQDGTPNCNDLCANDPAKTEEGLCGCGEVDVDENDNGICDNLDVAPAVVPLPAFSQIQGSGSSCSLNADASANMTGFMALAFALIGVALVRKKIS